MTAFRITLGIVLSFAIVSCAAGPTLNAAGYQLWADALLKAMNKKI